MKYWISDLLVLSIAAFLLLGFELAEAANRSMDARPNIVLIFADDLGYGDLGCYGREDIRTPILDQLARDGVRFTNCYANGPECSPTRTALMTGRYQQRVGGLECAIGTGNVGRDDDAIRLRETQDLGLPIEEVSIARLVKDAGYATAISGKWHLGYEPKFAPHLHGFGRTFYCIGGGMDYFHYLDTVAGYNLFRDGDPIAAQGYFTDLLTQEAVTFVERHAEEPFFLFASYTAPHSPFQGPGDFQEHPLPLDSPLWNQGKAPPDVYVAMIEHMDKCIGILLDTLDEKRLSDNTIVIFLGDNGGTGSARNEPLRGIKGSTFEGGIRVPGIVRWPGVLPADQVSDQVCITLDFSTSIVRLAGGQLPRDRAFDGIDIIGLLEEKKPLQRRTLFWRGRRGERTWRAVRDGDMKYVCRAEKERFDEYLFDLNVDVGEAHDLIKERPQDHRRLKRLLSDWEAEVRPVR
jgi:N-acetylgalactosamine-6-sulfatase